MCMSHAVIFVLTERLSESSAECIHVGSERGLLCSNADAGPAKVGVAMSTEACVDEGHSWTLRRISNGGGDYLGVRTADIRLSAAPTSGSFLPTSTSIVAGFRVTANIGSDLRYKNNGSVLQPWHRNLPTLEAEGSMTQRELLKRGTKTYPNTYGACFCSLLLSHKTTSSQRRRYVAMHSDSNLTAVTVAES